MMRFAPRQQDVDADNFRNARGLIQNFIIALDAEPKLQEQMLTYAKWRAEEAERIWSQEKAA